MAAKRSDIHVKCIFLEIFRSSKVPMPKRPEKFHFLAKRIPKALGSTVVSKPKIARPILGTTVSS
jgi:hypothetical protein